FTVNLLTLLAIVLSVGLVVDDAIVVVENVERHLREGRSPFDAAILSGRELTGPIIAMTVTLIAVYTPIGLQGGLTGSLFREFAFTLAGAVTISGVVALTLSPMLSSKLLNAEDEQHWLPAHINAGFERLKQFYSRVLDSSLSGRPAVYLLWTTLAILAVPMWMFSAQELAPAEDQGVIFGIVETSANATLDQTSHFTAAANQVFLNVPETEFTFLITFATSGFGGMVVKPWNERERTVFQILPEVQNQLAAIPGIRMFPITPPALPGGGQFPVEFIIASTADTQEILNIAQQVQEKAANSGMFAFPPILDVKMDQPQTEIVVNREKAAALGLSLQQIGADLSAAVGGNFVNRFNIAGRSYKVIPQVQRTSRLNPDQLTDIYVTGPDGQLLPLSAVATLNNSTGPRSLNRFQQLNAVKISGVAIRPLDEALRFLEDEAVKLMPKGYVIDYTGESRQLRQEGGAQFFKTMGFAIILIFLVLAAQFNSFRDPLIILLGSVPLALFGALIFTFLQMPNPQIPFPLTEGWTTTLNIYAKVGLVTLIGLIAKNGILIVEFANHRQIGGFSKLEAVRDAALIRLRPILMTTAATIAGHFPLTLVTGAGAAARNSIGLVLVGGIAIGTIFTLFVVPALYMLLAKDHTHDREAAEAAIKPHTAESSDSG
ncbi:MAG TPA: efflux RND transporter permease subunit, partial [Candidatus Competibacteraceae bacterium]|nr:efflux RND transporter permease subunit [Candidatus Competibacteraceae bacterium]